MDRGGSLWIQAPAFPVHMSMKGEWSLAVNGRALGRRVTGVERYASEITRRLGGGVRVLRPPARLRGPLGHLWEQAVLPLRAGRGSALWSPANSGPLAHPRQVVSVHDPGPLEHPEWYHPVFAALYRALLPPLLARAGRVAVPSRAVRQALLGRYPWLAGRLEIVPGGVDRQVFYPRGREEVERARLALGLPERYLLSVGSLQPRKNHARLLAAWELAAPALPGFTLALAGAPGVQFRREAPGPLPPRAVRLGYVPERLLPALYSGAAAFVLPSLDEGFGLPLLEALACGAPAAASACGALPELAGGAALLFDPLSPEAISGALLQAAGREDLRRAGQERAACFPWERSAARVRELLEGLA